MRRVVRLQALMPLVLMAVGHEHSSLRVFVVQSFCESTLYPPLAICPQVASTFLRASGGGIERLTGSGSATTLPSPDSLTNSMPPGVKVSMRGPSRWRRLRCGSHRGLSVASDRRDFGRRD